MKSTNDAVKRFETVCQQIETVSERASAIRLSLRELKREQRFLARCIAEDAVAALKRKK